MRILQILNRIPWPLKDGGSIGYYNFIKGYHDAGNKVTIAALNTSRHHVNMDELPEQLSSIGQWHATDIDTRVKLIPALRNLFSSGSYNVERFVSKEFEQLLLDLLKKDTYDVVIFESLFTMPYIDVVRNNSKALLVLRQHNVEHMIWQALADGERNPFKKWYLQLLTRRLRVFEKEQLNKADAITTVTENDAQVFREMGCTKPIGVFPLGIHIMQDHVAQAAPEIPSIFHIGSMEWLPNREAVMWFIKQVWNEASVKHPDLNLYIAGRGMPESFKKIEASNLHMIGEVEDAAEFMQQKQIMIVPLFSGSGIRVKILEAMAMGKAIISTTLGAQGIECENGKHLIIADNNQEFIKAIDLLVGNPQLAAELGNNARQLISYKYDNTKVIAGVLHFYHTQNRK
jgi:glycosyltransferase involved in cell wall biosynthesis